MSAPLRSELSPTKSSQRLPPPFLFQGPSSRNTSNLSLPTGLLPGPQTVSKTPSAAGTQPSLLVNNSSSRVPPLGDIPDLNLPLARKSHGQHDNEAGSHDEAWDQMQNTLAEVEANAVSGDYAFGLDHSKTVENLRAKQLALAQAWARNEADEVVENLHAPNDNLPAKTNDDNRHKVLDEKAEKDMALARKRRQANDRYFERVNNDVLDAVARLEDVAKAMQDTASKSKEIWSENESIPSATQSDG